MKSSVSLVDEWLGAVSMDGLISLHHMQKTDGPLVELSQGTIRKKSNLKCILLFYGENSDNS